MDLRTACSVAAALSVASVLSAQSLFASPAVNVSTPAAPGAVFAISGQPSAAFVLLTDFAPGPRDVFGETLELGLTPALFVLDAGALDASGSFSLILPIPPLPVLSGLVAYSQALFPTALAPNGLFTVSNGESTALFAGSTALIERFDNAAAAGFVGTYDTASLGRLRGTFSRRRVQPVEAGELLDAPTPNTVSAFALPFQLGIQSPLNPRGCRTQMVYRAADLQANGTPEVLTRVYWRVFDGLPVIPDSFASVTIRASHSHIVPNFLIGSFSALAQFPTSGLGSTFASNESSPPVLVRSGAYAIDPAALLFGLDSLGVGRYLDWGIDANFVYNGVDSLLLDVRTDPSPTSTGDNGAQVYLTVQSGPLPGARCVARPMLPFGTIDPDVVAVGEPDNAIHDMVFEFARVDSTALSPFRAAGPGAPNYQPAIVAASTPGTSSIVILYRGADDALGTNATAFSPNIDVADGKPFLQYSVKLTADVVTGAVPSIDTLVIPVQ